MNTQPVQQQQALPFSAKARRTKEQPISYLMELAIGRPELINLAAGLVDPITLPVEETRNISQRILSDTARGRIALQYDTTMGLKLLRETSLKHIETMEGKPAEQMGITADHLVITTGSQQALYLVGEVLIDPGDTVIAANPSYFVYAGTLSALGAQVLTVPMDVDGMDVEAVDRLLARLDADGRLDRVKLIYCTSFFQNPTGLTLAADRRPRLLEIARRYSRRHRILILEDAAYRELRYDGEAMPSIKSYDEQNLHTVLTHTFSKPFAPGLKTGYTAMPADLLQAFLQQKGNHDFGSANLTQQIAADALRDGSYHKHVILLQRSYRTKRDALLDALERYMPQGHGITWTRPHGGLYVWLTLPPQLDTARGSSLFQRAIERGVLYVPGDYCFQPDEQGRIPRNHIRLSFGQVVLEQIEPGIERLARSIFDEMQDGAPRPESQIETRT
jgi:2-aminoadipate transaminase